ncbi:uncharacterized protein LOC125959311 [Anopheles darlingi]|uniref:uncharacterized protein LOC125959311 n=1 Tax=Anopheles darlingi TaxID=43151 RepID=UPI00210018BA|nr:uncharacterized protein LOC125959311 [Anopheles darlingi]
MTPTQVLLCYILFAFVCESSANQPSFRIIAPKFLCNREAKPSEESNDQTNNNAISKEPSRFTIGVLFPAGPSWRSFQTNAGQRLQYRLTTYFEVLDGFVSQRHTLLLWRSVRLLERRVWREREMIADTGQLTIATDELVPGVRYTFGVVGLAQDGTESAEQNFTMTYRDIERGASFHHERASSNGGELSLLLLGAEVTYADVEYSVVARILFCHQRNDYSFRWFVEGLDEEFIPVAMERSNMLRIPQGSFTPNRVYTIRVRVCPSANGEETLTTAWIKVMVLEKSKEIVLFPTEAIVGFDQRIHIQSHMIGMASTPDTEWFCSREGSNINSDCNVFETTDEAIVTFHQEGQYEVRVLAANGTLESNSTLLTVNPKAIVSVKLLEYSSYPAIGGERFDMLVTLAGLVPNCASHWMVVEEDGYAYFAPTLIGGLGGLFIRDVEENFLSELVDYGNDTIERDLALSIPAHGTQWSGLEADVRYKFALETTCPEPIDDVRAPTKSKVRGNVTSRWTFVLETNGAPRGLPLEIEPASNGTALETIFKLSTGIAQDVSSDYPLRYSFWYVADGVKINIGTYYEITSAETVLPYTRSTIVSTYVIVCDSRHACSTIPGPDIQLTPAKEPSKKAIAFTIASIQGYFNRLNLREGLKTSFELLLTLRNQNSSAYDGTYEQFIDVFRSSLEHIGQVYAETGYLSESALQDFVAQSKPILDLKESTNHELFLRLLELLEPATGPRIDENDPLRSKRSTPPFASTSVVKVDMKLSLLESLTASKNASISSEARASLLSYVHQAAKSYCDAESRYVYAGQLIMLDVNRYRTLQAAELNLVHGPNNVLLTSGKSRYSDAFPENEYFCIGRAYIARDLFTPREPHELDLGFYEVFLLSVEKGGIWTLVNWHSDYFLWSLDGRRLPNVTCQLWSGNEWTDRDCSTVETEKNEVLCNCSRLAYLRITNETDAGQSLTFISSTTQPPSEPCSELTIDMSTEVTATSRSMSTAADHSLATSTVFTTSTQNDMVTFAPPIITEQPTNVTENEPSPLKASSESDAPTAFIHNSSLKVATIGYIILGALAISSMLVVLFTIIYRRRKVALRLVDELHTMPSRTRTQSPHVRYARFQDEHNMIGDNVSTISDVLTV